MKYKILKMTHRDRTTDKSSRHLQIQPQRNKLTKFAKKKEKKNRRETKTHKDKEEERGEE
jgi:hypothetical protein